MALSAISKHCIYICAFVLSLSVIVTIDELKDWSAESDIVTAETTEKNETLKPQMELDAMYEIMAILQGSYGKIIGCAITILCSTLMIIGIVKRSVLCMAPCWLFFIVSMIGGLLVAFGELVMVGLMQTGFNSHDYKLFCGVGGMIFVFLHPFVAVIREIHQERKAKRSLRMRA